MEKQTCYENYPLKIVALSLVIAVFSYLIGAVILIQLIPFGLIIGVGYLVLCAVNIIVTLKFRCIYCYYYGKTCYMGLGRLAKAFFKQGDSKDFKNPKNLVPAALFSFAILLIPIIGAIISMVIRYTLLVLFLFIIYIMVAFVPNLFLKKNLHCKYCKQGELGCPAYEGMQGKNSKEKD